MHKLTVTLRQHTPLIHFQHDQEGATLRASEVKPKLDRFILTKLGGEDGFEAGIRMAKDKGWLVGKGDHPALDYKMRIVAKGEPNEYLIASLLPFQAQEDSINILNETPYFAQEAVNVSKKSEDNPVFLKAGNGQNATYSFNTENWNSIDKKGLMWNNISIDIFSLNSELLSSVKENIAVFFICTNFGTRSTKGFGSFSVHQINGENVNIDITKVLTNNFRFAYNKQCKGGLSSIFKTIKNDYQKIKSGVNFNGYTKSILFCYAVEKMVGQPRWEKRFLKKALKPQLGNYNRLKDNHHDPIYDTNGNVSWNDPQTFNYEYIRAVLGVAEQFEFIMERLDEGEWKADNKNKATAKIKLSDVERAESPILIRVIGDTIYLVGNSVNTNILNKNVNITYTKGTNNINIDDKQRRIKTPSKFDLADFMNYAMGERFKLGYSKIK